MRFDGDGFVVVEPYEDPRRFALPAAPLERLAALITE